MEAAPTGRSLVLDQHQILQKFQILLRNRRESPLLRLPAELRNKIYEYALGSYELLIITGPYGKKKYLMVKRPMHTVPSESLGNFLALTRTCRQINTETDRIPYAINQFYGSPQYLKSLLLGHLLPIHRTSLITNLRLWLFERDVEDKPYYFRLQPAALNNLYLLRSFASLKQVTFEFNGVHKYHEWAYMRWNMLWSLRHLFKTGSTASNVEKSSWWSLY
ncbi:hypothetical protein NX059_003744 [Plenodomus lindquistii]|nr:hypothetical protein NX059_003744 [Plenodomus lindquistii]